MKQYFHNNMYYHINLYKQLVSYKDSLQSIRVETLQNHFLYVQVYTFQKINFAGRTSI